MRHRAAFWVAVWFGCGFAPVAPGTAGSLAALAIAAVLLNVTGWPAWSVCALALMGLVPAIRAAEITARKLGKKDPGCVVVDEVLGQWVTIAGATAWNWKSLAAAFLLFRVFDIWKPPPVRQFEALPGGLGIVMDDVMAGAYGALVLFLAGCFNLY